MNVLRHLPGYWLLSEMYRRLHNLFGGNRRHIHKGNRILIGKGVWLKKVKLDIRGTGNLVQFGDNCRLQNSWVTILGSNCRVIIGESGFFEQTGLYMEGENNEISIGKSTTFYGKTDLNAIESTRIVIGEDCMFSSYIHFRTGDSHSIINERGQRINPSKDIIIGNHVWVGRQVMCMKGTTVGDNCIIGAGALVSGTHLQENCVLVGFPARVIKENVSWLRERI